MKIGQQIEVRVISVHDFGVYVEAEGLHGFIQPVELSWDDQQSFDEVVQVDQLIKVIVLAIEGNRFSASLKRMFPEQDPWFNINLEAGEVLIVKVIANLEWGYIMEPEMYGTIRGVMLHREASRQLHVGEAISVKVKSFDREKRRIEFIDD